MQVMTYFDNLHVISKVSPRFPYGLPLEEYIVSEDCFYRLIDLEDDLDFFTSFPTNNVCDTQYTENDFLITKDDQDEVQNNSEPCSCVQSVEFMKILNKIEIAIDAILFSLVMLELNRSKSFRRNVLWNFYKLFVNKKKRGISNRTCLTCNRRAVKIHAIVFLNLPKQNVLDYKWGKKIQVLVNEKCELENAMAWLSTLGGAFSALGDKYIKCAEKAGAISIQQLYLALRLGDPLTICRCKIYLAMSLLQRGYYKKTKFMIRELYKFSTEGEGSKDFRLKNMCLAVWNRLRYLLYLRNIKKIKAV